MAYHCAVNNCSNGTYRLNKWKRSVCDDCSCLHKDKQCVCEEPFRLYAFPTVKKKPEQRARWKQLINRVSTDKKIWSPSKDSRVCCKHFRDGKPTLQNPMPTENLGYTGYEKRVKRMLFFKGDEKPVSYKEVMKEPDFIAIPIIEDPPTGILDPLPFPWVWTLLCIFLCIIQSYQYVRTELFAVKAENIRLRGELNRLKNKKYVDNVLDSDSNVNFFTGLKCKAIFEKLHRMIAPLVQRRWLGVNTSNNTRKFMREPKKFGPARKMTSRAEFLLTLMRMRLGIMGKDLAKRFDISEGLCSKIFLAWLKACSNVLGTLVFIPDEESLIGSKPNKFRHLSELHSIIDCTEIFIETPKDLFLQSATWSDYKHHNTMKVLVVCTPNSSIIFVSQAYTGRISDKALTVDCGFLDLVPAHQMIMADKGFNISNECAERHLTLYVPPGKRGKSQMTQGEVRKTKTIANNRIIIEQVIQRLKTFKIIQNELPISLIPHVDDILQVCAGICNLKDPIYK